MFDAIWIAVLVLLLANVTIALIVSARRRVPHRWLLTVLLTGTTGAAVIGVLTSLTGPTRFLDAALVLIALTALTAAVRVTLRPANPRRQETS